MSPETSTAEDILRARQNVAYWLAPAIELAAAAGRFAPDGAEAMLEAADGAAAHAWRMLEGGSAGDPEAVRAVFEEAQASAVLIVGLHRLLMGRHSCTGDLPFPAEAVTRAARVFAARAEAYRLTFAEEYAPDKARAAAAR